MLSKGEDHGKRWFGRMTSFWCWAAPARPAAGSRICSGRPANRCESARGAAEPRFDWEDRATWGPALQGVKAAYVAYQPDLAAPGALEIVDAFFHQAIACGVEKLVLLSGRGEVEAEQAEQALQATGVDWTILRASWFFQNFSEGFLVDAIAAGDVALPSGPAAEPFVDVDDIAEIAFAALTQSGHSRQLYDISGPRALTFTDAIGEIAQATGRDIRFTAAQPCGLSRATGRERRARRGSRSRDLSVHHRARRPQHAAGRWRAARAGTSAPGLFRLCPPHRGDRRLGRPPCLSAPSSS